jgi:hypothetical protein
MNAEEIIAQAGGTPEETSNAVATLAAAFTKALSDQRKNEIIDGRNEDREVLRKVVLSSAQLGTARLEENTSGWFKIPFEFKSVRVQAASGADVYVELVVGKNILGRSSARLRLNDTIDLGYLRQGWLWWPAQSGESMEIIFGVDINFRQGSQISQSSGGVTISEGTDLETVAVATVTSTAAALVATDTTRVVSTIQNNGGVDIFLGDSTVTALTGIKLAPGGIYDHKNADALYAITSGASNTDIRILNQR